MNCEPLKLFGCSFYRRVLGFVSFCVILCSLSNQAWANEEQEIRATFLALQKAFTARDGKQALALLSSDTKEYYRLLSTIASEDISLDKLDSASLTPLNLMMIKHVKKTIPKSFWKDFKKSNKDKLLKFAIDNGLGSKELTDNIRLGTIELNEAAATAKLVKDAKVLKLQLGFQKESGQWKVSLLKMFESANRSAEAFLKKTGLSLEELQKLVLK